MQTARTVALEIQQTEQTLAELTKWRATLLEVVAGSLDSTADDAQIQRVGVQILALENKLRTLKEAHFQASAADMLQAYRAAHQAAFDAGQRRIETRFALQALDDEYKARRQALQAEHQRAETEARATLEDVKLFWRGVTTPYGEKLTAALEAPAKQIAQAFNEATNEAARKRRAEREAKEAPAREAREAAQRAAMEEGQRRLAERAQRLAEQQGQRKPKPPVIRRAVKPQWAPNAPKHGRNGV